MPTTTKRVGRRSAQKDTRVTVVMRKVGAKFREMRKARKLTLAEAVSQVPGVSSAHLSRLERGSASFSVGMLPLVLTGVGASHEEIQSIMEIIFGESVVKSAVFSRQNYSKDDTRAILYWISVCDVPVSEGDLTHLLGVQRGQPKLLNPDLIRGLLVQRKL